MTNQTRLEQMWKLLNAKHHDYRARHFASSDLPKLLNIPSEEKPLLPAIVDARKYHEYLLGLSDEQLIEEVENYKIQLLADYEAAHWFNLPQAIADTNVFDHWSRAEYWSIPEAVALIHGRNPSVVTGASIDKDKADTTIGWTLKQTLELLIRAKSMGTLEHSNRPIQLIQWTRLKQMEMPDELVKMCMERGKTTYDVSAENRQLTKRVAELELAFSTKPNEEANNQSVKPIGVKERESLLKLILGISIKGYSYDPISTRSKEIKDIADDLRELNLSLDEDTIRKYLNEAKALFSDNLNRTE